ncbi:MAG: hypothetical protein IPL62_15265 [Caulobacteraceae bacterium]|nr:hypothetical protein [Caulobacteraceae bacterium]
MSRKPRVSFARFKPQARDFVERELFVPALVDYAACGDNAARVLKRENPFGSKRQKIIGCKQADGLAQELDPLAEPIDGERFRPSVRSRE